MAIELYQKVKSLQETSERINIPLANIGKWVKAEARIQESMMHDQKPHAKRIGAPGRKRQHGDIETEIVQWIRYKRELHFRVSYRMIAVKVMRDNPGIWDNIDKCRKWVYSIADRHDLSIRRKTHNQNTNMDEQEMGDIHLDFVQHVRELKDFHGGNWIKLNALI